MRRIELLLLIFSIILLTISITYNAIIAEPSNDSTTFSATQNPSLIENMVLIPAGYFTRGWEPIENVDWPGDETADDEIPAHEAYLDSFYIDKYEVTNLQFKEFVDSTGYITTAEKEGASVVIDTTVNPDGGWGYDWILRDGACWKYPQGPGSSITEIMDHPVVHVSWEDASAYADWIGKRLPTEAEWEKAARGKLERKIFTWGVDYSEYGLNATFGLYMNWHGDIRQDVVWTGDMLDGYAYTTAPVGSFPGNGYGLFDMAGNVFEYVNDWYDPNYYSISPTDNPSGPEEGWHKIKKGGSWSWCECYGRPASRDPIPLEYTDDCTGFRLAVSTDNSVTSMKQESIDDLIGFSLYHNYPNPFNPSTTISYTIPSSVKSEKSNVKLVVYDILGSKVATLVNTKQAEGNYEVEFSGDELTSGIYLYRLQADDFVETKKMILLK